MKRKRLFLGLLLILIGLRVSALPTKNVTVKLKNVSIEVFLDELKKQAGLSFLYNSDVFSGLQPVSVSTTNESLSSVLSRVLDSRGLTYTEKRGIVVIQRKRQSLPVKKLSGTVFDRNGDPLAGATIAIKYSNCPGAFVMTDPDGHYELEETGTEQSLTASYLGLSAETRTFKPGKKEYDFELANNSHTMDEVIVTGIFNKPKISFTGAATVITQDEIKRMGNRNLLKTLSNIDPSFDLQENNTAGSDPNQQLNIEIRGTSTIGNVNDLQSNVRNQQNLPLFILDGFEVTAERVMDMNQADVESVVILKDASATAIYGSRGANGVVVITSKHAEGGKLRISYQVGMNFEIPDLSSYNLMNSFEKLGIEKAAGLYTSTSLTTQLQLDDLYNQNLKAANEGVNTNWIKIPVRAGLGQYHKIDFSGGTDQFRYILNMSYNQITGAMRGSDRNNLNGNMTISYLLKKFRFTNNLSLGFNDAANSNYGPFSVYVGMNPYWRPYDSNGDPIQSYQVFATGYPKYNPLYDAAQTSFDKSDYTNVRNTTMLDVDLMPGLRLNLSAGFTQQRGSRNQFISPKSSTFLQQAGSFMDKGAYYLTNDREDSYQFSTTASWAKVFGEHTLFLGLNAQMMQTQKNSNTVQAKGFLNDQMTDISNANSYGGQKPSTQESTLRSLGYTGTVNYNYGEKYFVDFSYRRDAASSFGSLSRWAPFWSVGASWQLSNEKFVKKAMPFLNLAKLRYSYGVTGSLNFAPYDALTTYEYDNTNQYNYLIGATIVGYGNPDLKWQNTKEHNFGLDLTVASKFNVVFNYYNKTTDNLLSDAYLSLSHGYSSYKANLGTIRNIGYDLSLSYNIIKNYDQGIDWSVRGGLYHNSNVLVKLSDAIKAQNEKFSNQSSSSSAFYEYREGQSIDEIYVFHSLGIDPLTGNRLYVGTDGSVTTNTAGLQKIPVGNGQPKFNGRFGTSFRYKGFMVDLSFGCRMGGKKLNSTLLNSVENAYVQNNQDRRVIDLRWRNPGDIAAYKSIASSNISLANDQFVFTENTLTLNNMNFTYDFPLAMLKKYKLQRLSLTASMSDVFYISNIRMQRGTDYPYTVKPTFSIACTF